MLMEINHHRGDVGSSVDNREKPLRRREVIGSRAQVEKFDFSRIGSPDVDLTRGNSPPMSSCLPKSLEGKTKADPMLAMPLLPLLAGRAVEGPLPTFQCPSASFVVSKGREQGTRCAGTNHSC